MSGICPCRPTFERLVTIFFTDGESTTIRFDNYQDYCETLFVGPLRSEYADGIEYICW